MSTNPYTGSRTGDTDRRRIYDLLTKNGYSATEKNVEFILQKHYNDSNDLRLDWLVESYRFQLPDKK